MVASESAHLAINRGYVAETELSPSALGWVGLSKSKAVGEKLPKLG
jgi:hypothetical protein